MLTSAYNWDTVPRPIYRSRKGSSYQQWLCTLSGYTGSRVATGTPTTRVFNACRGVMKNDSQKALQLLPHAVVQALLDDDTDTFSDEVSVTLRHRCVCLQTQHYIHVPVHVES